MQNFSFCGAGCSFWYLFLSFFCHFSCKISVFCEAGRSFWVKKKTHFFMQNLIVKWWWWWWSKFWVLYFYETLTCYRKCLNLNMSPVRRLLRKSERKWPFLKKQVTQFWWFVGDFLGKIRLDFLSKKTSFFGQKTSSFCLMGNMPFHHT